MSRADRLLCRVGVFSFAAFAVGLAVLMADDLYRKFK